MLFRYDSRVTVRVKGDEKHRANFLYVRRKRLIEKERYRVEREGQGQIEES